MAITLSTTVASALADAITTAVDAGSAAGTLKVYTGSKPSTVETSATGTLLATFTLPDPVASSNATGGVATWNFTTAASATVANNGTAGWFRIADSDDNGVMDGTVGTSGEDLNFSSVAWSSGGTVQITAGSFTQPTSAS